ncbi:hypothetical protein [Clostridium estertheticum]|uniref:Uncharacterized protein n=1 Tax=Clostridium estertheticum TaxID=238834 RepID=A0AA47EEQ3_9CLOT|nr:hypothetical protein [Clostridium estertheticum]MBU3155027.1 hypothetical protein [Clostridium estertheticum]WAG58846.1 hypothetical protein LL038_14425 [Clostridium estertheticum]
MNKSRNIMKKVLLIFCFCFVVLLISFANRAIYGRWNMFGYPNSITFQGYRYYNNNDINNTDIMVLTGNDKPKYEVSRIIDRLTGKRIYSNNEKFLGYGKSVCLYLRDNTYLILRSDGGG